MSVSVDPGEKRVDSLWFPAVPQEYPAYVDPKRCGNRATWHAEAQAGVMGRGSSKR